jgi:hypothetical protein
MLDMSGQNGSSAIVTEPKAGGNVLGRNSVAKTTVAVLRMHYHTQFNENKLRVASVHRFRRPLT